MNLRGNDRFLVTGFLAVFVGAVAAVAQPAPATVGLAPDGWTGVTKASAPPSGGAQPESVVLAGPGQWRHTEKLAWGDVERIRNATESLMLASQRFSQQVYEQASQQAAATGGAADGAAGHDDLADQRR